MSHEINTKRDFQIGLEMAWHKLTRIYEKIVKEMFPVLENRPVCWPDANGVMRPMPGLMVAIASDDGLPVGNPFNPHTYPMFTPGQAWDYVESVLAGTDYVIESIGMLKDRALWFISTRLAELGKVSDGEIKYNLNFSGGLTKQVSPQCELSATRIVCANTMNISRMTGEKLFKIRTTADFQTKLNATKSDVEKACGMTRVFAEALQRAEKRPCDKDRAERIYLGYIAPEIAEKVGRVSTRTRHTTDTLVGLFQTGDGNKGKSIGDVLNGFTQLRTRGDAESRKDIWTQYESSEYGLFAAQKADFANLLTGRSEKLRVVESRGEKLLTLPVGKDN